MIWFIVQAPGPNTIECAVQVIVNITIRFCCSTNPELTTFSSIIWGLLRTFLKARPWTKEGDQALKEKADPLSLLTLSVLDVAVTVLVTYCSKSSTRRTQRNLSPPTVVISWDRMGRRRCSGTWGRASTNTRMILITTSSTLPEDSDKSLSSACAQTQVQQFREVTADGCKVFLAISENRRKYYVPDNGIAKCIMSRVM